MATRNAKKAQNEEEWMAAEELEIVEAVDGAENAFEAEWWAKSRKVDARSARENVAQRWSRR